MSKINAIRIVNLSYNNNTMKIDDELFDINGDNTLFSLLNGGGKSVIVQMVVAPFVHKNKRNLGKRAFRDYFTTNKPTFILVEWQLDGKAGYVLTGMMVRKAQEGDEDLKDDLDIINFIYEYKYSNPYDIRNIPIIEGNSDRKMLKGYQSCEKLFEEIKNKNGNTFFYYNTNIYAQQRNYFEKLEQYHIYYSEWESIIKEINLKESGLSELFNNAKDEVGLLEKWFLKVVGDKLNRNGDQIKKFEELMSKCIKQYKDNRYKLLKKQSMLNFKKETENIYQKAISYQNAVIEKQKVQSNIAYLLRTLKNLKNDYQRKNSEQEALDKTLKKELSDLKYQSLCLDIILKLDEINKLNVEIAKLNSDRDMNNLELNDIEQAKNLLSCAAKYKELRIALGEVNKYEIKLQIINSENMNLAPRRNKLGYALKQHYELEHQKSENELYELKKISENINSELKSLVDENEELQKNSTGLNRKIAKLETEVLYYNKIEDRVNQVYSLNLVRNILGLYEDNYLDGLKIKLETELESLDKSHIENQRKRYELEKVLTENKKNIENLIKKHSKLLSDNELHIGKDKQNEEYLNIRKNSIKYINLPAENIFDIEIIKEKFTKKIIELEETKRLNEKELDAENIIYKNLESGKVIELSYELEAAFANEDIRYIYGMDWLKNNGYKKSHNDKILKNNPMIPYSIIMSSKEISRLSKSNISVFTTEPIPIIVKESLDLEDKTDNKTGTVLNASQELSFYVLFNSDILDKNKLEEILEEKRQRTNQIYENIKIRENEINSYRELLNVAIYPPLTKEQYHDCKMKIEVLSKELDDNDILIMSARSKMDNIEEELRTTDKLIVDIKSKIDNRKNLLKDFSELMNNYQDYLSNLDEKSYLSRELGKLDVNISKNKTLILDKQKELTANNENALIKRAERDDTIRNKNSYISYLETDISDLEKIDVFMLKSEYDAISKNISTNQIEIEKELELANDKVRIADDNLKRALKNFNIIGEEYKDIDYDALYEKEFELNEREKKIRITIEEILGLEKPLIKKLGSLDTDRDGLYKRLNSDFKTDEILEKDEIRVCDFKKEIFTLQSKIYKEENTYKQLYNRLNTYQSGLNLLMQYEKFEDLLSNNSNDEQSLYKYDELEFFDTEKLNKLIRNLTQELNAKEEKQAKEHRNMTDEIGRISSMQEFNDDFYKNPLKNLYECRNIPSQVIEQLDTIWKSYSSLLEKLQVDIDIIEKEKAEIVNLFAEYVKSVHTNLDSIDKNSSINIRGRSIKMLKIVLPSWEDEESTYKLRVNEFVESLINSGISLLERNENIEDMLGKNITINNIYNRVVGCSKVSIKLYKIEANREIAITWAQAAKNSGGEGFLSAFVILSSLMMYLRRDETDIFLEKEEGKVLIMDNPFAQTSSEHLLKPLIDIAKKSNTQLICLTALGGDSIYNRFDNIYILNQTSSKLQNGITYLKGEHAKGEESTMLSSRILTEDIEQMTLF